ncbi:MAG: hypothetical protein M9918_11140 [Anaerolineae bacterium]|nr:hypothetical protein [Anaerolineae bacterium]
MVRRDVGDELTFRYNTDEEVTLTIAGIIANPVDAIPLQLNIAGAISAAIVSDNAVPDGVEPETSVLIVDAEPDRVDDTVIAISEIPGVFVFETSLINSFITAIVDQLTALPMVVAILALIRQRRDHRQYRLTGDVGAPPRNRYYEGARSAHQPGVEPAAAGEWVGWLVGWFDRCGARLSVGIGTGDCRYWRRQ